MSLEEKTQIGRYEIEGVIGRGGMGIVYSARHMILGTRHALKIPVAQAEEHRSRMVWEGRIQAFLDARYVVPVTDVVEHEGAAVLVMPYVYGCTLGEIARIVDLSDQEIMRVLVAMWRAVLSAHAEEVVHRDLKPGNVMIELYRGGARVRVLDFGLGIPTGLEGGGREFAGTPAYASPEQLAGAAADVASDLWALGVILFELVMGERPVKATSREAVSEAWTRDAVDWASVPEAWRAWLQALLSSVPEERLTRMHALMETVADQDDQGWRASTLEAVASMAASRANAMELQQPTGLFTERSELASRLGSAPLEVSQAMTNLPVQWDRFVGRVDALTALGRAQSDGARVVTITGVGGVGKTRLAVQFSRQVMTEYPGGAWFVDLSEAVDEASIIRAIAQGLGVSLRGGAPMARLNASLQALGTALLVLDNFEQVVDCGAELVSHWLRTSPGLQFLITSREPLRLPGEVVYPLEPLREESAVALFVDRARAALRGREAALDDQEAIRRIVDLVDRLPLAIELAAARVPILSLPKLLDRLSDRFRLLVARGQSAHRHQTIRGTIAWSWNLLQDDERRMLAALSVFEGPFFLDVVEWVVGDNESKDSFWAGDVLLSLIEKSLVRRVGDDRFALLFSVRAFAMEKLEASGEQDAAMARHAEYFARYGEYSYLAGLGRDGVARLQRFTMEVGSNLIAACKRAATMGHPEHAALNWIGLWEGAIRSVGPYALAEELGMPLLELPGLMRATYGRVQRTVGTAHLLQGHWVEGHHQLSEAAARLEAHALWAEAANAIGGAGVCLKEQGHSERALEYYERGLGFCEQARDDQYRAVLLGYQGHILRERGEYEGASQRYLTALRISEAGGRDSDQALALMNLGLMESYVGNASRAIGYYERAAVISQRIGRLSHFITSACNIATACIAIGRWDDADRWLSQAQGVASKLADTYKIAQVDQNLGDLALVRGEPERAKVFLEAAYGGFEDLKWKGIVLGTLALAEARLGNVERAIDLVEQAEGWVREAHWPVELAKFLAKASLVYRIADREEATHALAEAERISAAYGRANATLQHILEQARMAS